MKVSTVILMFCGVLLLSCHSSFYTVQTPVLMPQTGKNWHVIDSLITFNRKCDHTEGDRRVVWIMYWKTIEEGSYEVELVKDRIVPDGTIGCAFLSGEFVSIVGENLNGIFRVTETTATVKLDNYEANYPETFSLWKLKFIDDTFSITSSHPLRCREKPDKK